jgi:hypothetical protein
MGVDAERAQPAVALVEQQCAARRRGTPLRTRRTGALAAAEADRRRRAGQVEAARERQAAGQLGG